MKIIVNGCGKIGSTILANLVAEGHDVTAIDTNPEVIQKLTNIYDVIGVCGNGADSDVLTEANAKNNDLIISTANSDEINMLCCFLAKRMGTKNTVARVRNPEYNDKSLAFLRQNLEISLIINPELMASHELFNALKLPSAYKIEPFSVRNFEIVEFKIKDDSVLDGLKIADLRNKFKSKFLICAVQRGEEAYIPLGNFVLRSGDKVGITGSVNEILHFFNELGIKRTAIKKVMILGASKTAVYLAKKLCQIGNSVTIIDKDRQKCEEISAELPKALVVNGDGSSQELLIEEGISNIDAVVSLTGLDELNILISSYASSKNVPKVITKINRQELIPLAEHWGLDTVVSPRKTISNIVVGYARALENSKDSSVETLYKLMDDKVEALEFTVKDGLDFLNVAFKELKLKENILIAGIIRDRKTIIPSGEDVLLSGDKVVILAANQRINNLSDIIR
ncbi:MAG: Trk system potassium transporter TrkA [Clostridia bacterium]|nr:Trk system potassium transporter TrkA [Clostridia bacterium]